MSPLHRYIRGEVNKPSMNGSTAHEKWVKSWEGLLTGITLEDALSSALLESLFYHRLGPTITHASLHVGPSRTSKSSGKHFYPPFGCEGSLVRSTAVLVPCMGKSCNWARHGRFIFHAVAILKPSSLYISRIAPLRLRMIIPWRSGSRIPRSCSSVHMTFHAWKSEVMFQLHHAVHCCPPSPHAPHHGPFYIFFWTGKMAHDPITYATTLCWLTCVST